MRLYLDEIANVLNTPIRGKKENILIKSISINSKKVEKGALFIPIRGQRFDGHDFILEAIENGAVCFLSEKDIEIQDYPYLKVENTLYAMHRLASYYKDKIKNVITIGVTGSVGKTTTKEYIFNVLNAKYKSYKNEGNLNNHIGLPYSLLNMPDDVKAAVFEMGMSNFGEISLLSQILKPNIGIITNIGIAHIEALKSRENIFKAKSEIQDGMPQDGIIVINNDNDILSVHKDELKRKVVTIGIESQSDFRAKNIQKIKNGFAFEVNSYQYHIESFNYHDIYNSLFAVAVGEVLSIEKDLIQQGILKKNNLKRRFEIIKKQDITVIDDTYNASTHSMISAIDTVCEFEGKKILVLGDMLELGEFSEQEHKKLGRYISSKPVEVVFCIGQNAYFIYEEVSKNRNIKVYHTSKDNCLELLQKEILPNSVILFKASHGMRLDELVDEILRRL